MSRPVTLETQIGNDIVSIDLENIWCETFSHWDAKVPTETAAKIATAVEGILWRAAQGRTDNEHT